MKENKLPDISFIMPCLNEEQTVGGCIDEAKKFIETAGISGEILIVDNGSDDNSAEIAKVHGAQVIFEPKKGYGQALRTGINAAKGKVLIMGDSDLTYDFYHIRNFYEPLSRGDCDMVMGNRLNRSMEKGAMPLSHKIGVRFLSEIGRWRYHVKVRDFHCGLRGIMKEAANRLDFSTTGMEFATEMIAEASRKKLRIKQCNTTLRVCPYNREVKLRTFRDGWRHLHYLIFSK